MASSWNWKLLSLVFLLASSSAWGMAHARGGGLKHIHLYMHETFTGPNATLFAVVPPLLGVGDNTSMFGMVGVLDDELRDGPDPSNSSLVGRFQSLFAFDGAGDATRHADGDQPRVHGRGGTPGARWLWWAAW
uniref:Dirigent protein n=1 Tax=Triticum urartu TaxID=4572 RepID=A0A8R7PMV0_TRIUA